MYLAVSYRSLENSGLNEWGFLLFGAERINEAGNPGIVSLMVTPTKEKSTSKSLEAVNATLFGQSIFADVVKYLEIILDSWVAVAAAVSSRPPLPGLMAI